MSEVKSLSTDCMEIWLQFPFYEEKCKKYNKYNVIFCTVCMEEPVCERCWKEEQNKHKCHQILQVSIASRRPSIHIDNIRKCWDISYIQQYKINYKEVVYLKPKLREAADRKENGAECEICRGRLMDKEYKFCSIACKKETMDMGHRVGTQKNTPLNTEYSGFTSLLKKRRKGIPRRAPLK